MKDKWTRLIAEHLEGDYGHPDRKSYLMKEMQSVAILAGDNLIEVSHGEGYVFDIAADALILRNLGEAQPHRISWNEINEVSFAYHYAPARRTRSAGEEKKAAPPLASRL